MISKNNLYLLGSITLIGFPLVGILLNFLFLDSFNLDFLLLTPKDNIYIVAGLIFGISIAMVAERLSEIKFISKSAIDISELFKGFNMSIFDAFFLAFAAGFGEEVLFRASIQGFLGIWVTSLIFIAIHGYLNIRKLGMFIFGIYLVFFSSFLGYLYETYGLWASVSAHFSYDFVLLLSLRKSTKNAI